MEKKITIELTVQEMTDLILLVGAGVNESYGVGIDRETRYENLLSKLEVEGIKGGAKLKR